MRDDVGRKVSRERQEIRGGCCNHQVLHFALQTKPQHKTRRNSNVQTGLLKLHSDDDDDDGDDDDSPKCAVMISTSIACFSFRLLPN